MVECSVKRIVVALFVGLGIVFAGCRDNAANREDCELADDEDLNGSANCSDPACAGAPSCQVACGNGRREAGEACDDGNLTDGDSCDKNCTNTACGNGIKTMDEACDDGNAVDGDGCDSNCVVTGCGNGIRTGNEACDDGNTTNGDGCDANCVVTGCGNGIRSGNEACDDGNTTHGDGCDANCTITACGNGVMTGNEACDDGNTTNGDTCDNNCTLPACGNGEKAPNEGCDDSNLTNGDGCDSNCTVTACGNGVPTAGETCDDGNLINGDGCDNNCTATGCRNGVQTAGEACDDGNLINGDGCDNNCTLTACGNGVQAGSETCDDGNTTSGDGCDSNCTVTACGNSIVTSSEQCDDGNLINGDGCNSDCTIAASVLAYLKASNTGESDGFGGLIALSADGSTLAVSAPGESSSATGVGGDQANNDLAYAGAVYVFTRSGGVWTQQAYIKASNTYYADVFGTSLALSADGSILAVGAYGEASAATGIDGDQTSDGAEDSGAVYVFTRSGATWSQQAYLKASNTGAGDFFGQSVALSADGSTLAVGADSEGSAATGINGDQTNNAAFQSGAVYVFTRSSATWTQQVYIKGSNTGAGDRFGHSVTLSTDGSTLAVGAGAEDSAATGINGDQTSNAAFQSGAVYVFTRSGATWTQQAYIKASNTGASDFFGERVALSADGSTLAVGGVWEDSAVTGIGGDQTSNSAPNSGAVYVLTRTGTVWSQQAYVKASNTDAGDEFGRSVALSADGSTLAVGALKEASGATGIGGDQTSNSTSNSGAIYMFTRTGTAWSQTSYVKASNTDGGDQYSESIALSSDGSTLAAGAPTEGSASTGVNNTQTNNSVPRAGAVYVHLF